jgi:hypothetical protein
MNSLLDFGKLGPQKQQSERKPPPVNDPPLLPVSSINPLWFCELIRYAETEPLSVFPENAFLLSLAKRWKGN